MNGSTVLFGMQQNVQQLVLRFRSDFFGEFRGFFIDYFAGILYEYMNITYYEYTVK